MSSYWGVEKQWLLDFVDGGLTKDSRTGWDVFQDTSDNSYITLTNYSKDEQINIINTFASPNGNNDIRGALVDGIAEFKRNGLPNRQKVAIVVTDGQLRTGNTDPCDLADEIFAANIRVIVIGFGNWTPIYITCVVMYPDTDIVPIGSFSGADWTEVFVDCLVQHPIIPQTPTTKSTTLSPSVLPTKPPSYSPTNPSHSPSNHPTDSPTKSPTSKYHTVWQTASFNLNIENMKWTHFIYMIADNDREYYAVRTLNAIAKTRSLDVINFVVFIDRCMQAPECNGNKYGPPQAIENIRNCQTNEEINGTFAGAKLLQKSGNIWCEIIDFGDETNSLLQSNIIQFTSLLRHFQHSTEHICLEFWDHGGAWKNFGQEKHKGDAVGPIIYNVETFICAIDEGLSRTDLDSVDILAIDACTEADQSILYYITINELSKYYIASERNEPSRGWDYVKLDGTADPIRYGKIIIDSFVALSGHEPEYSYTLALFDIDRYKIFMQLFDHLIINMTTALSSKDYGMMMSILRAEDEMVVFNNILQIGDAGSFLNGLLDASNKFFQKCFHDIQLLAWETLNEMNKAILYFKSNCPKLEGYSFFVSKNKTLIQKFEEKNYDGMEMVHYGSFLMALSEMLSDLQSSPQFKSVMCFSHVPSNLHRFSLSPIENETDNHMHSMKFMVNVTSTVKNGRTIIYLQEQNCQKIALAKLHTVIHDADDGTTQLQSEWNGQLVKFVNSNNDSEFTYSTGTYICSQNKCTIQFPVYIAEKFNGYLEMKTEDSINNTHITLWKRENQKVTEISANQTVNIAGLYLDYSQKLTISPQSLQWPHLSLVIMNIFNHFNQNVFVLVSAKDILGNTDTSIKYLTGSDKICADNNNINLITLLISISSSAACICVVLVLCYYTRRIIARRQGGISVSTNDSDSESDDSTENNEGVLLTGQHDVELAAMKFLQT